MANTDQPTTVRIRYVQISKINEARRNPKGHDLDRIERSIAWVGFIAPMILDQESDTLVAGHGRLEALRRMHERGEDLPRYIKTTRGGHWTAPVLAGVGFTEEEREFYILADNRLVEMGGWDENLLAQMLGELADQDQWDMLDIAGFDADDLAALVPDIDIPLPADDEPQPRLDERVQAECPECGHTFRPAGIKMPLVRQKEAATPTPSGSWGPSSISI